MDSTDEDLLFELVKLSPFLGELPEPAKSFNLENPLCGDEVTFYLIIDEARKITQLKFQTKGCFICRASAAVLAARADQKSVEEVVNDVENFRIGFVDNGEFENESAELLQLVALRSYPTRAKCVLLPFEALGKLLKG